MNKINRDIKDLEDKIGSMENHGRLYQHTKRNERTMETRTRRIGIKHGEIRQKPFTFRIDNENLWFLETLGITNKGRFINEAIAFYIRWKCKNAEKVKINPKEQNEPF